MDGILNVIKPVGMTSFDVVALVRRWTGTRKVGHTGTLDPDAAGVLTVCVGRATRAVEALTDKDKTYRAELCLGVETDTQDATGSVTRAAEPVADEGRIAEAIRSMAGDRLQVPPMHSAIKIDGKKLYELAREGREVERKPRPVSIHACEPVGFRRDADGTVRVLIDVRCSKGTYIRTLCHDIGRMLGCGGHMVFLLRTRTGPFRIEDSHTLEALADASAAGTIGSLLEPVDAAFAHLPALHVPPQIAQRLLNGQTVPLDRLTADQKGTVPPGPEAPGVCRVYEGDRFLGLGATEMEPAAAPDGRLRLFRQMPQAGCASASGSASAPGETEAGMHPAERNDA